MSPTFLVVILLLQYVSIQAHPIGRARGQRARRYGEELPQRMTRYNADRRPMRFYSDGCAHGGAASAAQCRILEGNSSTLTPPRTRVTYQPGEFSDGERSEDGMLILSNGLAAKPIASKGMFVELYDGGISDIQYHSQPDGAAVFAKEDGGWYYVSNNENETVGEEWFNGGVGSIEFNRYGQIVGYKRVASRLRMNCSGGKTPWNSWITCEEIDFGKVYQVDPSGVQEPVRTDLGDIGHYESFAYDDRDDADRPTFYVTRDSDRGALTRFTPDDIGMECFNKPNDYDRWCTLNHGTRDYLLISGGSEGTFEWTTDESAARDNAEAYYPNSEGIDVVDGMLYTTSKIKKQLMILNLRNMTYTYQSTVSGAFDEQPDQVARLVQWKEDSILYFCEDGGLDEKSPGLFGRSPDGQYFTILYGTFPLKDETTGLAFSPDGYFLYLTYQKVGTTYRIWRQDGLPFTGAMLDIKYHASSE